MCPSTYQLLLSAPPPPSHHHPFWFSFKQISILWFYNCKRISRIRWCFILRFDQKLFLAFSFFFINKQKKVLSRQLALCFITNNFYHIIIINFLKVIHKYRLNDFYIRFINSRPISFKFTIMQSFIYLTCIDLKMKSFVNSQ